MMFLREYRARGTTLSDFLPWAALIAPGVVLNKDGSFQRTASIRGPDLDSATPAELVATAGRLNSALRRLGSGWAIFFEAQRVPALDYPDDSFPDPASALVERERREQFAEEGAHFESAYFLTLQWMPPPEDAARAEGWLYEGRSRSGVDPHELLASFVDRSTRLLQLLEGFVPEARWLDDGETLTYLHATISTKRQRVGVPDIPMYLDSILADETLVEARRPASAHADRHRLSERDLSRPARRPQSASLSVSLGHTRDHARQDRCDQAPFPHPPPMVREAQVDRRDPQGSDDQRGVGAGRQRRFQQGGGR